MKLINIDIDLLRALVFVSNAQGFTKAAEQLFRTQSAISLQIKKLEQITNNKLLERGKEIRLTPVGQTVYEYALKILTLNDDLIRSLSMGSLRTEYRISLPEYYDPILLKVLIDSDALHHAHSTLSSTSPLQASLLIEQQLMDIAFILHTELLGGTEIADTPLSWVSATGAIIFQDTSIALALPAQGSFIRLITKKTLDDHAHPSIIICSAAEHSSLNPIIKAGKAIGVMPKHAIPDGLCIITNEQLPRLPQAKLFIKVSTHADSRAHELAAKILAMYRIEIALTLKRGVSTSD